jgi:hypothetical protein
MKRSRMLQLFGGLFLMLLGYAAWCGRTFYLRPQMPDLSRLPVEAQELARLGIEEAGFLGPERVSFNRFTWLIGHPYKSEPVQISIDPRPDVQRFVVIYRSDGPGLMLFKSWKGWSFMDGFGPRDQAAKVWN